MAKYTSEFKREAVKLIQSSDKPTIVDSEGIRCKSKEFIQLGEPKYENQEIIYQ